MQETPFALVAMGLLTSASAAAILSSMVVLVFSDSSVVFFLVFEKSLRATGAIPGLLFLPGVRFFFYLIPTPTLTMLVKNA
jgi:hypothetical protein